MVRTVDYEARRKAVLHSAINRHIKNALPVASDDIAREFDLSSATIRNIFAELEEEGYLRHPYTSGGKVPTNKGYRYYVDFLTAQMEILDVEKERITREYEKEIKRLEDVLEITSGVISEITHYASIVSLLEWQDKFFYKGISLILEQPEFRDFQKLRLLIKVIEDKQNLLEVVNRDFSGKVKIYIGEELGCPAMENCSIVVSSYRLKNKPLGKLAVLGPARMEYTHVVPTLEYIADALTEALERI